MVFLCGLRLAYTKYTKPKSVKLSAIDWMCHRIEWQRTMNNAFTIFYSIAQRS